MTRHRISWKYKSGRFGWVWSDEVKQSWGAGTDEKGQDLHLLPNRTWVLINYRQYDYRDWDSGETHYDFETSGEELTDDEALAWLDQQGKVSALDDWPPALADIAKSRHFLALQPTATPAQEAAQDEPKPKGQIPRAEAEIRVRNHLREDPEATIRSVVKATGVSAGRVSRLLVWQAHLAAKKDRAKRGRSVSTRQLTDGHLAVIGTNDDPSAGVDFSTYEETLKKTFDAATPEERERLHKRRPAEKAELIRAVQEQQSDVASERRGYRR